MTHICHYSDLGLFLQKCFMTELMAKKEEPEGLILASVFWCEVQQKRKKCPCLPSLLCRVARINLMFIQRPACAQQTEAAVPSPFCGQWQGSQH